VIEDFASALTRAETLAPHGTILVTGSVHTVGDALAVLEIPLA
jgi:folylpolyglutamate synthase/dihydropteroate synthase